MSTHVMVDLETLGNGSDAHILSIGAVKFDSTGILDRFHVGIDLESCARSGLKSDVSTIEWWLDLTCDAPEAWRAWKALDKVDVYNALDGFAIWYKDVGEFVPLEPTEPDKQPLWGNGATFDNVILRNAFKACRLDFPVPFWLDRCYRTLKAMAPEIKLERKGTHHSAVDDAESQALHLIRICKDLEITL